MDIKIGQIIQSVATSQGLNQKQFGLLINRTKQGVASIYKRATIETSLLALISEKLNHDFFSYYYQQPPLNLFKERENKTWENKIAGLQDTISAKDELLATKEELLVVQRKYISELEKRYL